MGKLVAERINYEKLGGELDEKLEWVLDDLMRGFKRDFSDGAIPEFIEVYGGSGEERRYVIDGLLGRTRKIVWGHQERTDGGGVYRVDLDWFLNQFSKRK
jgi:hypothetical protein